MTTMVNVNGIGDLPDSFAFQFDGIDIKQNIINGHNEGMVSLYCKHDAGRDDKLKAAGYKTNHGYHLKFDIESESRVGLWNNGTVFFDYNEQGQTWSMRGMVRNERFWTICNPSATVSTLLAGLQCYLDIETPEEIAIPLTLLISSLELSKDNDSLITEQYGEVDCSQPYAPIKEAATFDGDY